jgi:hypothetical protein
MDYDKPYRFEVKNQEGILIVGNSGIETCKIEFINSLEFHLKVRLLKSGCKRRIPFNRIEKASLQSIRLYYPECFI